MYHHSVPKARDGLTRFEVIVAVVTCIITAACLLVYFDRSRYGVSNRYESQSRLKQIVLASINYADQNNGKMPAGRTPDYSEEQLKEDFVLGPCLFQILPQMDNDPLFKESRVKIGEVQGYAAWELAGRSFKPYIAPSDPTNEARGGRTSYLANELVFPLAGAKFPDSISDGPAQTIFFAEANSVAMEIVKRNGGLSYLKVKRHWWDKPVWTPVLGPVMFEVKNLPETGNAALPQGYFSSGILVALGDGSARNVVPSITNTTFFAACTPASKDTLGDDW